MQGEQPTCAVCGERVRLSGRHVTVSVDEHTPDGSTFTDSYHVHPECWNESTADWALSG